MRILHVSFSDGAGGAAIAAHRLMRAQRAAGIDAEMLVVQKQTDDPAVSAPLGKVGRARIRTARFACRRIGRIVAHSDRSGMRTIALFPSGLGRVIGRKAVDVVHLHWLGSEMMSLEEIASIPHPIVWTCHDMWAFCGAEHYSQNSDFIDGYMSRRHPDIDLWTFRRKQQHWADWHPTLICPSRWMAENAARSILMRDAERIVVSNTLDMDTFKPMRRKQARVYLNLPSDKKLILFGADGGPNDPRKGFDLIKAALSRLSANIDIAVFGGTIKGSIAGHCTHAFGKINDEQRLAALYSAADLFVAPSRLDNLPNTLLEAQSCGTPCVAFDVGGMKEIISTSSHGALAVPFDVADLATEIRNVLAGRNADDREKIRKDALIRFNSARIISQHIDIYRQIIRTR